MKLSNIIKTDIPVVTARKGLKITEGGIEALKGKGVGLVSAGLNVGEVFEFPDTIEDVKTITRQVRENSDAVEVLLLGLKNGKPAWLSTGNLRRMDVKGVRVHPVSEALKDAEDDQVRIEMCLGKKITAKEEVTYQEAIFDNGTRTDGTRPRTVAKLIFAE